MNKKPKYWQVNNFIFTITVILISLIIAYVIIFAI